MILFLFILSLCWLTVLGLYLSLLVWQAWNCVSRGGKATITVPAWTTIVSIVAIAFVFAYLFGAFK
jgi:hypothetical protein